MLLTVASVTSALDAISGASRGRNMVTVSAITVTTTSAALTYSEGYSNGTLRFYYSTTKFASAADTTRATVTKVNVTKRGSGTLTVSGLTANTTYYFRFQGYYPKGVANYWASGSFATTALAAVTARTIESVRSSTATIDALGRRQASGASVGFRPGAAVVQPQGDGR